MILHALYGLQYLTTITNFMLLHLFPALCDELITRPEVSYRLWRIIVCTQETLCDEEAIASAGLHSQRKKNYFLHVTSVFLGCNLGEFEYFSTFPDNIGPLSVKVCWDFYL
jgi:hypothetical protein